MPDIEMFVVFYNFSRNTVCFPRYFRNGISDITKSQRALIT